MLQFYYKYGIDISLLYTILKNIFSFVTKERKRELIDELNNNGSPKLIQFSQNFDEMISIDYKKQDLIFVTDLNCPESSKLLRRVSLF